MKIYSDFIKTIYDQQEPVGKIGRGMHYSVLRAPVSTNLNQEPSQLKFQNFAILWDEDHDERVLIIIEHLLFAGLLAPVKFIGERKGMLEIILDNDFCSNSSRDKIDSYKDKIESLTHKTGDFWPVHLFTIDSYSQNSSTYKTYIENIQNLHDLGIINNVDDYLPDYSKNEYPYVSNLI